MKVIDVQTPEDEGKGPGALGRAFGKLRFLQSRSTQRAQEITLQNLKKVLDNRFIMLRGLVLAEIEPPAPFILVGPPGIWLIEVNENKGVFRAVDDQWEEMDSQTRKYRAARVNLPAQTASQAQTVTHLLTERGLAVQSVEPVIFFTHPGAHVKTVRSPARLVQSDAILRFCTGLLQSRIVYEPEEIQAVIHALTEPAEKTTADEAGLEATDQSDSSAEIQAQKKDIISTQLSAALNTNEPAVIRRLSRHMAFTQRQWLILGALLMVNILLFITIIMVVLAIT